MPSPRREIVVDTRPLWIILLTRGRRIGFLVLGPLLYWAVLEAPTPDGLSNEGHRALAVFAICVFLMPSRYATLMYSGSIQKTAVSRM